MKFGHVLSLSLLLATACGKGNDRPSSSEFEQSRLANAALAEEVKVMREERSGVANQLTTYTETIRQLQGRITDLGESNGSMETAYKTQLDDQNKILGEYKAELAKLQVQATNTAATQAEKQAAQEKLAAMEAKSRKQEGQIVKLAELLNNARATQNEQALILAEEIKLAKGAYDKQVAQLASMEAQNAHLTKCLNEQKEANRKLVTEAEKFKAENERLTKELSAAREEIKKLELKVAELQGANAELKGMFDKSQGDLAAVNQDLGAAQAKAEALQEQLTQALAKIKDLESKNNQLENQVGSLESQNEKLKADKAAADQKAQAAQAEAAAAKAAADAAKAKAAEEAAKAQAAQAT